MLAARLGQVAGALLAMWLLPHPAASTDCEPLADVAVKFNFDLYPMPEEAVQPMLGFHNVMPPASEDFWGKAVYGTNKDGIGIILWMNGDEVCGQDSIDPPTWARLKALIEGTRT